MPWHYATLWTTPYSIVNNKSHHYAHPYCIVNNESRPCAHPYSPRRYAHPYMPRHYATFWDFCSSGPWHYATW